MCVCVCMCVCVRERERQSERERDGVREREREKEREGNVVCSQQGHFKTRLFTADTISYFQELLLKETWEVIHQEHDINKIFSKLLRIYLNIFEASFPVIYHDKHNTVLGLQGTSEYHVNRKGVCIFSLEIVMTWN